MKKVIVYTKNNCPECEKVKFNLGFLPPEVKDSLDIVYLNIDEDEEDHNNLISAGYQSVPVTFVQDNDPIVGFDMGALQESFGI